MQLRLVSNSPEKLQTGLSDFKIAQTRLLFPSMTKNFASIDAIEGGLALRPLSFGGLFFHTIYSFGPVV